MRLTVLLGWILAIAFVAAMVVPVYTNGPHHNHAPGCVSHLKQIGLGLIIYAGDENDRFPLRDGWADAIVPYTKAPDLFYDPALFKDGDKGPYAYAFNGALSTAKMPKEAATTPLVYDSVVPVRNASDLVASLPAPGRHQGKDNMAYADGHAKAIPVAAP